MENNEDDKLRRAKKRVEAIKGFFIHLAVYLAVNAFILIQIYLNSEEESFWQPRHFFTLVFWGLGLAFHWFYTYDINPFCGKQWEEKQIRKYMEEDKKEAEKYL